MGVRVDWQSLCVPAHWPLDAEADALDRAAGYRVVAWLRLIFGCYWSSLSCEEGKVELQPFQSSRFSNRLEAMLHRFSVDVAKKWGLCHRCFPRGFSVMGIQTSIYKSKIALLCFSITVRLGWLIVPAHSRCDDSFVLLRGRSSWSFGK